MSKDPQIIKPSKSEFTPMGEPEKATYPTNTRFRNIILIVGVVLLAIGFIALLWLTLRPKSSVKSPDGKVQQFEQKSQDEFINTQEEREQQP